MMNDQQDTLTKMKGAANISKINLVYNNGMWLD